MTEDTEAEAQTSPFYGFRLRFRTTKGFTTDDPIVTFELEGQKVTLARPDKRPLREGGWFSLKATGFASTEDAESLGKRLSAALQIASIRCMLGVDVGEDKCTSSFSTAIVDNLAAVGCFVRPNIHGLDVFEDKPGTSWFNMSARGSVSTDPEKVFADVGRLLVSVGNTEPPKFDAVRLLNEALICGEPPAQLVLAIAAVEMLAQGEDWTASQKDAVKRLVAVADRDVALADDERKEVIDAIQRMYRMGVMEGFRRLLKRLALDELWKPWRDVYIGRSKLLHGLTYAPLGDRSEMVMPALLLSSRIVLTALDTEFPGAAADLPELPEGLHQARTLECSSVDTRA